MLTRAHYQHIIRTCLFIYLPTLSALKLDISKSVEANMEAEAGLTSAKSVGVGCAASC